MYYVLFFSSGAFFLYQIDRAFSFSPEDARNVPERLAWIDGHRVYVWVSTVASAAIIIILLPRIPVHLLPWFAGVGIVGLVYALPSIRGWRRLKSIPYLKSALISFAWILCGVLMPAAMGGKVSLAVIVLLFFYKLPVIIANLQVADFIDRDGDRRAGHKLVISNLSENQLKRFVVVLLSVSIVFGVAMGVSAGVLVLIAVDLVGVLLMLILCLQEQSFSRKTAFNMDILVGWPLATFVVMVIS